MTEDELQRAKAEVNREHRKTQRRTATGQRLGEWFREKQEENGWRSLVETIVRGNT